MIITTDGLHNLFAYFDGNVIRNRSNSILVSGSLGGGTATLGYKNSSDTFVPFKDENGVDVTLEPGYQYEVRNGYKKTITISMSGSSGAALDVEMNGLS